MWRFVSQSSSDRHPHLRSLNEHIGRQTWEWDPDAGTQEDRDKVEQLRAAFVASKDTQKHSSDELLRLQAAMRRKRPQAFTKPQLNGGVRESDVITALRGALGFYEGLQADDGHWPGDYGGPMFLMPGMLIALYVSGKLNAVLSPQHRHEMVRYLVNHQNADGGYGLHIEGGSTMFGTALNYVSLRILGMDADHEVAQKARRWIHSRGGATYITSWGKFWLATLGVYQWEGQNPLPPEMWLLPHSRWTGIGLMHPGRFWCHCRMVYLPMCYIWGMRGTCKRTALTAAIRDELYPGPYEEIDWDAARNRCAKEDLYYPHPLVQDVLWWTLSHAEPLLRGSWLRKRALEEAMRLVHHEDEDTRYVCIGPVNKTINMLACWFEDPDGDAFKWHLPRLLDYLWLAEDGMKMQGYSGSQLWDTAFAVQAILTTGLTDEVTDCLQRAHHFIDRTQVREEATGPYRHISSGAWPFSTRDHGWPISDCTSEGVKAALGLAALGEAAGGPPIPPERIFDAANVILSYQNYDGGWATYENTRSFHAFEILNPAETFGDIMLDYSCVECSSACITALAAIRRRYPGHRASEVERALSRGGSYVRSVQQADGSWYGSWGVCFTYGTWFGVEALVALGDTFENSPALQKACEFLLHVQRDDGGWAESYLSCVDKVYTQLDGDTSHVVNTAWGLLSLVSAGYRVRTPLDRAAACLLRLQLPTGDWPQQHISGVFNRNCMISYANYRNIFPIWALGEYRQRILKGKVH